jgi:hypothetical protein
MSSQPPTRPRGPAASADIGPDVESPICVYLASRFARRDEMREIAQDLEDHGFVVTSRWLESPRPLAGADLDSDGLAGRLAAMDLEDLQRADVCISFTEPPDNPQSGRGGRHAELGIALGMGRHILLVGPREHVFHCLPQIDQYPDWETARQTLLPAVLPSRLAIA